MITGPFKCYITHWAVRVHNNRSSQISIMEVLWWGGRGEFFIEKG